MILLSQLLSYDPGSSVPHFNVSANHYGRYLNSKRHGNNLGKHWTWGGTYPHNTPMHHYASLTGTQKAGWRAVAAYLPTQRGNGTFIHISSAVIWQIINRGRADIGQARTDNAPPTLPHPSNGGAIVYPLHFSPLEIITRTIFGGGGGNDWAYVNIGPWVPAGSPPPAMKRFRHYRTIVGSPNIDTDISADYARMFGQVPHPVRCATKTFGFQTTGQTSAIIEYFAPNFS